MDDEPARSPEATHAQWLARELGLDPMACERVFARAVAGGRRPAAWHRTRRRRRRMEAMAAGASVLVMVGVSPLLFAYVSEAAGLTVGLLAAGILLISFAALFVEIISGVQSGAEEDEAERAVARLVSGRGIAPPPPDER
jgi:hypothetical protein